MREGSPIPRWLAWLALLALLGVGVLSAWQIVSDHARFRPSALEAPAP